MKKFDMLFNKNISIIICVICIFTISSTTFTFARFVTVAYGYSETRVALFGNSVAVEITNIKGKPGDVTVIPIKISNVINGRTCEVTEKFTMYVNRAYGTNIPLEFNLYKDKECTTLVYRDENNNFFDDDFIFSPTNGETKTYYLKIEWPEKNNDATNAFEIDYLSLYFRVTQVN